MDAKNNLDNDSVLTPEQQKLLRERINEEIEAHNRQQVFAQLSPEDIEALEIARAKLAARKAKENKWYNRIKRFFCRLFK